MLVVAIRSYKSSRVFICLINFLKSINVRQASGYLAVLERKIIHVLVESKIKYLIEITVGTANSNLSFNLGNSKLKAKLCLCNGSLILNASHLRSNDCKFKPLYKGYQEY